MTQAVSIQDVERVSQHSALMQAACAAKPGDVQAIAALRKLEGVGPQDAALTLQLATGRSKAIDKFGEAASSWLAWPEAIEQATSLAVGAHKARWFKKHLRDRRLIDGCCGIGGDLFAFRQAGIKTLGVDSDPVRAWMAAHNANDAAATATADLAGFTFEAGDALHLDPGRRAGGRRLMHLEDLIPGPDLWEKLLESCPDAGIKLAPGVDPIDLEEAGLIGDTRHGHVEYISLKGRMVQAVVWTGVLARDTQTAASVIVSDEQAHTFSADPDDPPLTDPKQYLYTVDPAIERADLFGAFALAHGLEAIHPQLGIYTSDTPVENPWLTGFELLAETPWRLKTVQRELKARGAGVVEVRTRGKAVDPDIVQKQLRRKGDTPLTVFILRDYKRKFALITRRLTDAASS